METITMIVARYNENLGWLEFLPKNINVLIYNKGSEIKDQKIIKYDNVKIIDKLTNTGRETETYFRYIIANYDKFPDVIIFTQGNPLDHCPNFSHLIYGISNGEMNQNCFPLSMKWNDEIPPEKIRKSTEKPYYIETASRFTLCPIKHWDEGVHGIYNDYCYNQNLSHGSDVFNHFCNLINLDDPQHGQTDTFDFFYCGIFAVKKEAILKYTIDFYINCLGINSKAEYFGYIFERTWWKMFS